jgi:hypothetical protein
MTTDTDIELSGAFQAKDSNGRTLDVKEIRIFDEGYGIIDVYVEFAAKLDSSSACARSGTRGQTSATATRACKRAV